MIKKIPYRKLPALVCLAVGCVLQSHAYAQENKEYLVKAAFIYNFVKFVEWPGAKAISAHPSIDICVMGDEQMMTTGSVFKAASTAKLTLALVSESTVKGAAEHCHVLYIGEGAGVDNVLRSLKDSPVLTVSDAEGFVDKGGMVGFVMNDNKIKLEVNTRAVGQAGMRVDAQLLEIALRVVDK